MVVESQSESLSLGEVRALWLNVASELAATYESEPIEDCVSHSSEQVVEREAQLLGMIPPVELVGWLSERGGEFAMSVLCTVGRCDVPNVPLGWISPSWSLASTQREEFGRTAWRRELVTAALESPDIRIRDAVVQAVENWEDPALLSAFVGHDESVAWLRDYMDAVTTDLSQ